MSHPRKTQIFEAVKDFSRHQKRGLIARNRAYRKFGYRKRLQKKQFKTLEKRTPEMIGCADQ